jgi:hypothetical protein
VHLAGFGLPPESGPLDCPMISRVIASPDARPGVAGGTEACSAVQSAGPVPLRECCWTPYRPPAALFFSKASCTLAIHCN